MEYHDKVLKCAECGAEFVFTAGEQMFFADKGFKNEPKRCKACKAKRAEGGGGGGEVLGAGRARVWEAAGSIWGFAGWVGKREAAPPIQS